MEREQINSSIHSPFFFGPGLILYASTVMWVKSFSFFTPSSLYLWIRNVLCWKAINTIPLLNVVQSVSLVVEVPLFEDFKSISALLLGIMFESGVAEETGYQNMKALLHEDMNALPVNVFWAFNNV